MELRSTVRCEEFKRLQLALRKRGYYEEDMKLQEMRQILKVLLDSTNQTEEKPPSKVCSERNKRTYRKREAKKTNTVKNKQNIPPSKSNGDEENTSVVITVQAIVHHPMDWSPSSKRKTLESSYKENLDLNNNQIKFNKKNLIMEKINFDEILPCAPEPDPIPTNRRFRRTRLRRL